MRKKVLFENDFDSDERCSALVEKKRYQSHEVIDLHFLIFNTVRAIDYFLMNSERDVVCKSN